MAGRPGTQAAPVARPPGRRWPPRAILNALMSLAVIVLERRIRKALRSSAGSGRQPG
jgi:hypothetical protein